jgi:HSP20 family protein
MSVFTNAVNELLRLQGELDSRLRSPGSELFFGPSAAGVYPPVNVFRDPNGNVVIRAELPGLTPEGITVTCEQRRLTLSGERTPPDGADSGYHRRERPYGKFSRSIQLPVDLDIDHAEAKFNQGVMTLSIPQAAAAKPRQISVQAA